MATTPPFSDTPLLLDNDVFTHWRNQSPQIVFVVKDYISRLKSLPKLPAITIFEAQWGIEKEGIKQGETELLKQKREKVTQLIQVCGVLDFNQNAAAIAAYVFARLSQSQRNQHWKDVFIAATALAHHHGIATHNRKDFELIGQHLPPTFPVLRLAIWKP